MDQNLHSNVNINILSLYFSFQFSLFNPLVSEELFAPVCNYPLRTSYLLGVELFHNGLKSLVSPPTAPTKPTQTEGKRKSVKDISHTHEYEHVYTHTRV